MNHELSTLKVPSGPGYLGGCSCSDPDYAGGTWAGYVSFYGATEQEVIDLHHDHVLEAEGVQSE